MSQYRESIAEGSKTGRRPFHYTNSVDIWSLGKIFLELLDEVPDNIKSGGKLIHVNKEPGIELAERMMADSPEKRPTATECLKVPWLNVLNPTIGKRDRSAATETLMAPPSKK